MTQKVRKGLRSESESSRTPNSESCLTRQVVLLPSQTAPSGHAGEKLTFLYCSRDNSKGEISVRAAPRHVLLHYCVSRREGHKYTFTSRKIIINTAATKRCNYVAVTQTNSCYSVTITKTIARILQNSNYVWFDLFVFGRKHKTVSRFKNSADN